MRTLIIVVAAVAVCAICRAPAGARDLGVRGEVWPLIEADLLESIEDTLLALERSGALARLNEEAASRARERVEAPEPVVGIVPAMLNRTRLFDPSITVGQDILGPGGRMIAAAGTRVNPLAHRPLTGSLLFIDGTREAEVDWALAEGQPSRIVLLAGRPLDLARRHGRPFYFDQAGALSSRFGLSASPTRVRQDGAMLRIEEIALRDGDRSPGDIDISLQSSGISRQIEDDFRGNAAQAAEPQSEKKETSP